MDKGVPPLRKKQKSFLEQDDNTKLLRNCIKLFIQHIAGNLELWLT